MGDPRRYTQDPALFRMEVRTLEDGRTYGASFEEWQERFIFGPIDAGKHCFIQTPRGHDKTGSLAWCAIRWLLFGRPEESIVVVAADEDQARLVAGEITKQMSRVPWLGEALALRKNRILCPDTGSEVLIIASDAGSSYGLRPTRIVFEELHAWSGARAEELWDSLWGAAAKRDAQIVVITNAGAGRDWKWTRREMFREQAEADPEHWHFWSSPGWVASWSLPRREFLERGMHPLRARRFLDNEWTEENEGAFCTIEQAENCLLSYSPTSIPRPHAVAQGVDLGLTHDAAAVAVVGQSEDGTVYLLALDTFPGSKASPVLLEAVEEVALRNVETWRPSATLIDPWQAASMQQRIGSDLRAQEFTFSTAHLQQLTEALWQKVSSGAFRFYPGAGRALQAGEEWDLLRELKSAVVRETSYGSRLDHRSGGYSDRLVSIGMAVWSLAQEFVGPPVWADSGPQAPYIDRVRDQMAERYRQTGREYPRHLFRRGGRR